MKTAIIALCLACFTANSQTNKVEVIPELVTASRTYKNATIGQSVNGISIVRHDGGISRVPVAELPEKFREVEQQKEPTASIVNTNSLETQKKIAEKKAALAKAAAWRGEPQNIIVKALLPSGACLVSTADGDDKEVRITGLPPGTGKLFSDLAAAEQRIPAASEKLKQATRAYEDVPSEVTGPRNVVARWKAQSQTARDNMRRASDELDVLTEKVEELRSNQVTKASFQARQTAQRYGKWEIWEYYGPFVEKKRKSASPDTNPDANLAPLEK